MPRASSFEIPVPDFNRAVRFYFVVQSIEDMLATVVEHGGRELYPKTSIGELGFVAEVQDSEGNRIALSAPA